MDLAARHAAAGVILESAFASAFTVVTRVRLLPFDRFPNVQNMRRVHCPVLIIHGTRDEVIPFTHGKRLYDAAPEPRLALWVEGAHHNDVTAVAGPRYVAALKAFVGLLGT
jgi:fermentation-respiration switch protein FrsA (DUF1100 family)